MSSRLPPPDRRPAPANVGDLAVRTGLDEPSIRRSLLDSLACHQAKLPQHATAHDWYVALALTVRDRLLDRSGKAIEAAADARTRPKVIAYLSAEFLPGPHLGNGLLNLGIVEQAQAALASVGQDLAAILDQEEEPGLGNGGLGRLAACYMDSLATLQVPAIGYGIRYEFGIFDQTIRDGWQVEITDKWLRYGNPWEIVRPEIAFDVGFGGQTEHHDDSTGRHQVRWSPRSVVKGVAYDTPIPGYRAPTSCACGRRRPPSHSTSKRSTSAIITAPSIRRWSRKRSPRCSTPTTSPRRARSCGCSSSTSSSPVRCRT
jgi:starch phosphorylase